MPQRIEAFSVDVKETLEDLVNCLQYYAVILDESMNVKDTAQCMNSTFNLTQELFELVALKGRTTWKNMLDGFLECTLKIQLDLKKLVSVTIDGVAAMADSKNRSVPLL